MLKRLRIEDRFQYRPFRPFLINHAWNLNDAELGTLLSQADRKLGELNALSQRVVPWGPCPCRGGSMGAKQAFNQKRLAFFADKRENQDVWCLPLTVLLLIAAHPAYAYLDPGTGSMVAQIVAATVFGGLFFIKSFWKKTVRFCRSIIDRKRE